MNIFAEKKILHVCSAEAMSAFTDDRAEEASGSCISSRHRTCTRAPRASRGCREELAVLFRLGPLKPGFDGGKAGARGASAGHKLAPGLVASLCVPSAQLGWPGLPPAPPSYLFLVQGRDETSPFVHQGRKAARGVPASRFGLWGRSRRRRRQDGTDAIGGQRGEERKPRCGDEQSGRPVRRGEAGGGDGCDGGKAAPSGASGP